MPEGKKFIMPPHKTHPLTKRSSLGVDSSPILRGSKNDGRALLQCIKNLRQAVILYTTVTGSTSETGIAGCQR